MSSALNRSRRPSSEVPLPSDELQDFGGLDEPMMPGSTPSTPPSAQLGTSPGGGRLGIKAAVARPAQVRREDAGLAFEPENRAVDVRLLQQHAGVVGEVAGGEIVRAVHHDVVGADDVQGVLAGEAGVVKDDLDVRVEAADWFPWRTRSWAGRRPRCRGESGAGGWRVPPRRSPRCRACRCRGRQVHGDGRAEPAGADAQHAGERIFFWPSSPTSGRIKCRE